MYYMNVVYVFNMWSRHTHYYSTSNPRGRVLGMRLGHLQGLGEHYTLPSPMHTHHAHLQGVASTIMIVMGSCKLMALLYA